MRFTFVVFIIGLVLSGCEQKPKYSFEITNDSSKAANETGDQDEKNSVTVSWSKKFRDKLTQECIDKVSEKVSATEAFRYCNCLSIKIEAKYPDEEEVGANLSQADIESMKPDCLSLTSVQSDRSTGSQGWSAEEQKEWMNNCTPDAGKTLGRAAANDYCDCMMKKLMKEYTDAKDIGSVPQSHLNALASDCLGK